MTFPDHFSADSNNYARHRPRYPDALFAWLAENSPSPVLAIDVATGNGQAAIGLAAHFADVHAFDASAAQIRAAERRSNIHYAVAPAEKIPLPDHSADLITVAQALHWFELPRFHSEVTRVLKPGGVIAAWTYNLLTVSPPVDALITHLYHDVLGAYWPAERRHVENGYAELPFPFTRLARTETFPLAMQAQWDVGQLLGYLRTWSAWKAYTDAGNVDPVSAIAGDVRRAFGAKTCEVRWPLTILAGRQI